MLKYLLAFALLSLTSCETIKSIFPSVSNQVAALESTLSAAEVAGDAYINLPRCGTPHVVICSNLSTIKKIKSADNVAVLAIRAAEKSESETEFQAAQTAVTAFKSIVDSTGANP